MSDSNVNAVPFSKDYVLRITLQHMQRAADTSITKTAARVAELGQAGKAQEALETIDVLNRIKRMLDDFKSHNPALFNLQ